MAVATIFKKIKFVAVSHSAFIVAKAPIFGGSRHAGAFNGRLQESSAFRTIDCWIGDGGFQSSF